MKTPPPPPPRPIGSTDRPIPPRPPVFSPKRSEQAVATFNLALEQPTAGRVAFVAQACGGDEELQSRVEELLAAHEKAGGFLDEEPPMTPELEAELERLKPEEAGEMIGNCKLREEIGEGGFGTVWVADQEEPVRRRVALKIIKMGMDTKDVIARFEAERQALAMMDHPNIAKVFDAGATKFGRPFFVMELVKGMTITKYCDEAGLTMRERLALFGDVCSAINHAHQKGIIHRDIKPSNVLVTLHGDKAVVKVIDFGIAKATQGRLTDHTVYTQFEQMVGTPAYMSPEQAGMSGLDVDTRSDIYALGVLLYELLIGKPPFDGQSLINAGYEEMRRIIREVEPVKPSSRLTTIVGEERTLLAKSHRIEPEKIGKLVEPDLDWIVMKAIEKDRTRRYETANAFAQDVVRFLADEPVTAGAPSAAYKFRKFARRNKTPLQVALVLFVVLVAATVISIFQAMRATYAERQQRELRQQAERLNVQLLRTRADVYGRQGEWEKAAADLRDVLKLDDSDHWDWFRFAVLLVQNGEGAEYAGLRREMLTRFRGTEDPRVADRIAKTSLLLPGNAEEIAGALALSKRALLLGENDDLLPYFQLTAALAAYRAGEMAEARAIVEELVGQGNLGVNIHALTHVLLAMLQQDDGEVDEARETMRVVDKNWRGLVKTTTGTLVQNYWQEWWHDWLILQIIRAEAEATLK